MPACPNCGTDNPPQAKFCLSCGSPVPSDEEPTEVRKTVTLVFCDITGSTALAEKMDYESYRTLVQDRYFREMSAALESHGGTIEKYIGDAVMAVFGIPVIREDDALRGVRAAFEMQEVMRRLSDDFMTKYGRGVKARIGVNTGEVIAGDHSSGHGFATGDTVNVAARLEQAAPPGETLLGEDTYRLVRDHVEVEQVEPLELKGKAERVPAYRLVRVLDAAPASKRNLESPFVGRTREMQRLQDAFDRAARDRTCNLVTILGPAGAGKSRLAGELCEAMQGGAQVLQGRCLSYGEGITFYPLSEAVAQVARVDKGEPAQEAQDKIRGLVSHDPDADLIAQRLSEALGLVDARSESQELFWAVRKFFEALAEERPLVVVFEDLHWAEPTFLDLVEYLVGWSKDRPILLVCEARNELIDVRPTWGSGRANAETIPLEPLAPEETDHLVELLLGGSHVPEGARRRITEASEGNPLFVEEMLRMLIDDGLLERVDGRWTLSADVADVAMPGTIQALVAARIDRLDAEERAVIGRGSVIGRAFWWGAISHLTPEAQRGTIAGHLQTLVRRELILPEESAFPGEDAFRFSSALIGDAAYQGLAKKLRADLHEAFSQWLERKAGDRIREHEEILGHHLEKAYTYRRELGMSEESIAETGRRAASLLASSGRRALARADVPAATNLLRRGVNLLPENSLERAELSLDLFAAEMEGGDFTRAETALREVEATVSEKDDRRLQARAQIQRCNFDMYSEAEEGWKDKALACAKEATKVFKEIGDEVGLTQAHQLMAEAHWTESRYGEVERLLDVALLHAQSSGSVREESKILGWLPSVAFWGPTPVERALKLCQVVLQLADGNQMVEAKTLVSMAGLYAMRGDFAEARKLIDRTKKLMNELGLAFTLAAARQVFGMVEMMAGDAEGAEREFRDGYETLEEMGDKGYLPSFAASVAEALYELERFDEAQRWAQKSRDMFPPDDVTSKTDWGPVTAKLLARAGKFEEAERLARDAVEVAAQTDEPSDHADALMELAEVFRLAARAEEAASCIRSALELYEKKGVKTAAEKARTILGQLAA